MGQLDSKQDEHKSRIERVAQELSSLSNDELLQVFQQAELGKRGFQLRQDSTLSRDAQLSDVGMPRVDSIQDVDNRYHNELRQATHAMVFGASEASTRGLQRYIDSICNRDDFTFQERRAISRALNFWKKELGLRFYFKEQVCLLSVPTAGGYGQFRIVTPGRVPTDIANSKCLPALRCRK